MEGWWLPWKLLQVRELLSVMADGGNLKEEKVKKGF